MGVFSFLSPPPWPIFFNLTPTPLGNNNYFLGPILHSYQIQDGGLIRKCTLACIQYACTAGYPIYNKFVCLGCPSCGNCKLFVNFVDLEL